MNLWIIFVGLCLAGDVQWDGVSHDVLHDRRPLVPVNGEAFDVYVQTYRLDVTSVRVHVDDGAAAWVSAAWVFDRGPYAVWKATIPATSATVLRYYFEITDEDDTDFLSRSGMSDDEPTDGGFVIDRVTLSHAPPGATPVTGGVLFKVWAPHPAQAWVRGEFNGWGTGNPMTRHGDYFVTIVSGAQDRQQYKYYFEPGALWKPDARARRLNPNDSYNSRVDDPLRYAWSDSAWATPPFEDLIIYELHVGTFAGRNDPQSGGAFPARYSDVAAHAAHLAELGVNMVELMPIQEFPTSLSIGYNPITQFAAEQGYGNTDDLKAMINALHQHGVGVMLDIVWNHFSPTDNFLWNYDSNSAQIYYRTPDLQTPWGSQADFGRNEVREYFLDSARLWLDEYHVDGFRMDATDFMNLPPFEGDGWSLMQAYNWLMDNRAVHKFSVAEQLPNDAWITRPRSLGGAGFDAQWHDAWTDGLRAAIQSAAFGDPDMNWLASAIGGEGQYMYGPYLVRYMQLHDEILPSTGGQRLVKTIDPTFPHDDFYARSRHKLGIGLTMLIPGIPAIIMGDEWLDDADLGTTPANRIDWQKKITYAPIFQFTKDVIQIRKTNGAFRANAGWQVFHVNDTGNVIAFQRYDNSGNVCVVVGNFSNADYNGYRIGLPQAGEWSELLNSQATAYDGNNVGNGGGIVTEPVPYDGHPQSARLAIPQSGMLVFRWGAPPPPTPCPEDVNGDRAINLTDLAILLAHFGQSGATPAQGDVDADSDVDLTDLAMLLARFGTTCPI